MALDPIQEIIAAFLIGGGLNLVLFGISWLQYVEYLRSSHTDRPLYRLAAFFVFVAGALHSCFAVHSLWAYSVDDVTGADVFASAPWSFGADPVLTALVASVVQASYARRIWTVSKRSWVVPGVVVALTGLGIYCSWTGISSPLWSHIATQKPHVGSWLFSLAAADLVIVASLTYYLRRSRSDFEETNSILDKLIRMTVQNNGLTALSAVLSAALFVSNITWHLIFGLVIAKLYTVSFFSAMNARRQIARDIAIARAQPRKHPHSGLNSFASGLQPPYGPGGGGGGGAGGPAGDARIEMGTQSGESRARSFRPSFRRSRSAGDVRKERRDYIGEGSLSVQVVVESTTTEDRAMPADAWDREKQDEDYSRPAPTIGGLAGAGRSMQSLRIAPFLAVPPSAHHQ
ncbi:hypothetical protein JCM8547_000485 [Rhodosporidiobolus lusitaniae]